jgi:hypothetical protein
MSPSQACNPEAAVIDKTAPPAERRAAPRHAPGPTAACHLAIALGGVVRPVVIRDISTGGIDLIVHRPFEPGTDLALELLNAARNFSRTVRVHVVHADPQEDGEWSVGFAFARRLQDEELQALL